jgi:hypothetical protein
VFGLDWTAAPLPPMPETEASVQAAKLAAVFPPPVRQVAKVESKQAPVPTQPQQRRPQQQVAVANPAPPPVRVITPASPIMEPEQSPAQADAAVQSKCDVNACSSAYRSFRVEDCTWQPYDGPRRFCDKGTPPANVASIDSKSGDTTASIGGEPITVSNKCDVGVCKQAYFTFDPADCTYQPSHGPRRICERGTPPKQDAAAKLDATANAKPPADETAVKPATEAANPKCNVEACRQAYFTFTAEDCTYQPSMGARRLCTK